MWAHVKWRFQVVNLSSGDQSVQGPKTCLSQTDVSMRIIPTCMANVERFHSLRGFNHRSAILSSRPFLRRGVKSLSLGTCICAWPFLKIAEKRCMLQEEPSRRTIRTICQLFPVHCHPITFLWGLVAPHPSWLPCSPQPWSGCASSLYLVSKSRKDGWRCVSVRWKVFVLLSSE